MNGMVVEELRAIAARGESDGVEFKNSTAQLPRAGETLCGMLNAVMHRDYSNPGGDIAIAVFDDRIEISSYGNLLPGVTPELLSGPHKSILRNPLIAQTFHRAGAVETWGRGTNRVIDVCKEYGVEPPVFELQSNNVVVTFRAAIGLGPNLVPDRDQVGTKSGLSQDQVRVIDFARITCSISQLMEACGRSNRTKFRDQVLRPLLEADFLQMTIPDKPRSSKQQYRTTLAGERLLKREGDR